MSLATSSPVDAATCLALQPRGPLCLSGHADGAVAFWQLGDDALSALHPPRRPARAPVTAAAFADDSVALTADADGTVALWRVGTGDVMRLVAAKVGVPHAALLAAASCVVVAGTTGLSLIAPSRHGADEHATVDALGPPRANGGADACDCVCGLPSVGGIASAGRSCVVIIWRVKYDPRNGRESLAMRCALRGHRAPIRALAAAPIHGADRAARLVSADSDGLMRVWLLSDSVTRCLYEVTLDEAIAPRSAALALSSATECPSLAYASKSGAVRMWSLPRAVLQFANEVELDGGGTLPTGGTDCATLLSFVEGTLVAASGGGARAWNEDGSALEGVRDTRPPKPLMVLLCASQSKLLLAGTADGSLLATLLLPHSEGAADAQVPCADTQPRFELDDAVWRYLPPQVPVDAPADTTMTSVNSRTPYFAGALAP